MNATFSVKNFERFQHYKDRSPPWIRLYNSLLDDYEFGRLPDASKAHLLAIWLLASRYENKIPLDPEWVGRRINATERVDLDALISSGFIVPDQARSDTLAGGKQDAKPEERRAETEKISLPSEAHPADAGPAPEEGSPTNGHHLPAALETPSTAEGLDEDDIPSALDRRAYPPAFEELWQMYREEIGEKNSSKAVSFQRWKKLSKADQDACFFGLVEYCLWAMAERKKRADVPLKHLEVFINKRSWEPYLEKAA